MYEEEMELQRVSQILVARVTRHDDSPEATDSPGEEI